jgi:hypothetical protein
MDGGEEKQGKRIENLNSVVTVHPGRKDGCK